MAEEEDLSSLSLEARLQHKVSALQGWLFIGCS